MPDSTLTSFVTSGFDGIISPAVRTTHEVLAGWNLFVLAAVLLLVVLNKQLYPRQFRQLLSVPAGVAHTNQLLREWMPSRSFIYAYFALFEDCSLWAPNQAQRSTRDTSCFGYSSRL